MVKDSESKELAEPDHKTAIARKTKMDDERPTAYTVCHQATSEARILAAKLVLPHKAPICHYYTIKSVRHAYRWYISSPRHRLL